MSRPSTRKNQPESIDNHEGHLPDQQMMRKRCAYCAMEGKENRTFVICLVCNILLCLVKERNCSQKHHIQVYIYIYIYIYTLYIFTKMLWFFVWFLYISTASLSWYIYNFLHICPNVVICPNIVKEMQLELVKIIPTNQLMLYLICHFSQQIHNERGKTTFSTQKDTSVPQNSC